MKCKCCDELRQEIASIRQSLFDLDTGGVPTIAVSRKTAQLPWAGIRTDGTVFNATVTEDAEGQWTMTFNSPHPSGAGGWLYQGTGEEDGNRDNPKITLVDGSDTANDVQIMVTVDDNGTGADIFEDNNFSFIVYAECEFIDQVYIDGEPATDSESDAGAGDGDDEGPSLPPADGKVVSDNFQDGNGNAPFNLQVRNTTGNPVNWEALVSDVSYSTIPNLTPGNYTHTVIYNGDGTYDHLFTGTQPLAGFQNITITGGAPNPPGTGSGLTLFCESA